MKATFPNAAWIMQTTGFSGKPRLWQVLTPRLGEAQSAQLRHDAGMGKTSGLVHEFGSLCQCRGPARLGRNMAHRV